MMYGPGSRPWSMNRTRSTTGKCPTPRPRARAPHVSQRGGPRLQALVQRCEAALPVRGASVLHCDKVHGAARHCVAPSWPRQAARWVGRAVNARAVNARAGLPCVHAALGGWGRPRIQRVARRWRPGAGTPFFLSFFGRFRIRQWSLPKRVSHSSQRD